MSKHTPGPWLFCTANEGKCKCHIITTEDIVIAKAYKYGDTDLEDAAGLAPRDEDEVQANVRLIAAAPQMAAALVGLLEAMAKIPILAVGAETQTHLMYKMLAAEDALDAAGVEHA